MTSSPASSSDPSLTEAVRARARDIGFDLVGFGPAEPFDAEQELILEDLASGYLQGMGWITAERVTLSCHPETLLPEARSIVALGTSYNWPDPDASEPAKKDSRGRVARYAWGRDYHRVIPPRLRALADAIVDLAGPDTRCRAFVDTGPLVDRAAAARAGLGFVGKNTNILTGRHGSYVFLSAILTTARLDPDPIVARDCGSCRACLDACPTNAFVAPRQLDATRCISYLTIEHRGPIPGGMRPLMGQWVFGCDVCQEVCPWNRARPQAVHEEFAPERGAGPTLDLEELLGLDDKSFRSRFRETPLMRTKRAGLLRNAAVALGNLGDLASVPTLIQVLRDPAPVVRSHAAWALGRMPTLPPEALRALEAALAGETDGEARAEIAQVLAQVQDPCPVDTGPKTE